MGFTHEGEQFVTRYDHSIRKNKIWPDIVENSEKIIHLLDMCGHEKYLKTTMHGMNSLFPDYAMIFIGANMGLSRMTMEHLFIAITLNLPVFVVFTKVDIAPAQILAENMKKITKVLKQHCGKLPMHVKDTDSATQAADVVHKGKVTPIFTISNHTGEGVDILRNFISKL
jgi:GTPase